jgi:hypothetical protein
MHLKIRDVKLFDRFHIYELLMRLLCQQRRVTVGYCRNAAGTSGTFADVVIKPIMRNAMTAAAGTEITSNKIHRFDQGLASMGTWSKRAIA